MGGHLPATADSVARSLADYAGRLATKTLKQRLPALAQWHAEHGFAAPTRAPVVRKVLKGIQTLHPSQEKRTKPLQLAQLGQVVDWLEGAAAAAGTRGVLPGGSATCATSPWCFSVSGAASAVTSWSACRYRTCAQRID